MLSNPIYLSPNDRQMVAQMIQEASASGVGIPWFTDRSAAGKRLGLSEFLPAIMISGESLEENYESRSKSDREWIGSPEFAQQAAFILGLLAPDAMFDSEEIDPFLPCWFIARQVELVTGAPMLEEAAIIGALASGFSLCTRPNAADDLFICHLSHLALYRALFKLNPEAANA